MSRDRAPAAFGVTALAPPSGVEPASGLEQSRSSTGAKTIAFTDEHGNRFIFPSWIIYPDDPDAPSASTLWWQAHAICARLCGATHEWIELDPEQFPHVRGEARSGIFMHGAATTLLFAGPDFEAIAAEQVSK